MIDEGPQGRGRDLQFSRESRIVGVRLILHMLRQLTHIQVHPCKGGQHLLRPQQEDTGCMGGFTVGRTENTL